MAKDFYQGQKLKSIDWPEARCEVGSFNCTDIEVVMENGQMAGVPWALATYEDGTQFKHNLALAESVKL